MKNIQNQPKIETLFYIMVFASAIIGAAIQFFLSGKIINIPFDIKEKPIYLVISIVLKIIISAIIIFIILLLISQIRQLNIKQQPEVKKLIYFTTTSTAIVTTLIQSFLNGEIIDISYGTHEGGIISAIGVGVIIIVMIFITFITY